MELFPLTTSDLTVGRKPTAWRLTGVVKEKRDFSFRLKVNPRPVGMWKLKLLYEPTHPGGP